MPDQRAEYDPLADLRIRVDDLHRVIALLDSVPVAERSGAHSVARHLLGGAAGGIALITRHWERERANVSGVDTSGKTSTPTSGVVVPASPT